MYSWKFLALKKKNTVSKTVAKLEEDNTIADLSFERNWFDLIPKCAKYFRTIWKYSTFFMVFVKFCQFQIKIYFSTYSSTSWTNTDCSIYPSKPFDLGQPKALSDYNYKIDWYQLHIPTYF